MGEYSGDGGRIYVVEETVNEDEVKSRTFGRRVGGCIGDEEVSMESPTRDFDITRIDINTQITSTGKIRSIGARAATHVKNLSNSGEVGVLRDVRKFLTRERELGEVEQKGLFEEIVEESHGRQ